MFILWSPIPFWFLTPLCLTPLTLISFNSLEACKIFSFINFWNFMMMSLEKWFTFSPLFFRTKAMFLNTAIKFWEILFYYFFLIFSLHFLSLFFISFQDLLLATFETGSLKYEHLNISCPLFYFLDAFLNILIFKMHQHFNTNNYFLYSDHYFFKKESCSYFIVVKFSLIWK